MELRTFSFFKALKIKEYWRSAWILVISNLDVLLPISNTYASILFAAQISFKSLNKHSETSLRILNTREWIVETCSAACGNIGGISECTKSALLLKWINLLANYEEKTFSTFLFKSMCGYRVQEKVCWNIFRYLHKVFDISFRKNLYLFS